MRRWILLLALGVPLATSWDAAAQQRSPAQRQQPAASQPAPAQTAPAAPPAIASPEARQAPPHAWLLGVWTGGQFPVGDDVDAQTCLANATVIFLPDLVMRSSALDIAWRQRVLETVAATGETGLEFRFAPAMAMGGPFGARVPPDAGFGCDGNPNILRVQRRGPDEIVFPNCAEFPSPLKRCGHAPAPAGR